MNDLHKQFVHPNAVDLEEKLLRIDGIIYLNFGMYKGKPLGSIGQSDPAYLKWILSKDFGPDTKKLIEDILTKKT